MLRKLHFTISDIFRSEQSFGRASPLFAYLSLFDTQPFVLSKPDDTANLHSSPMKILDITSSSLFSRFIAQPGYCYGLSRPRPLLVASSRRQHGNNDSWRLVNEDDQLVDSRFKYEKRRDFIPMAPNSFSGTDFLSWNLLRTEITRHVFSHLTDYRWLPTRFRTLSCITARHVATSSTLSPYFPVIALILRAINFVIQRNICLCLRHFGMTHLLTTRLLWLRFGYELAASLLFSRSHRFWPPLSAISRRITSHDWTFCWSELH